MCNYSPLFSTTSVTLSLVLLLIFFVKMSRKTILSTAAFVIVVIGGVANLRERLEYGCVQDYLDFFGLFHFNANDVLIILGLGVFFVQSIYGNNENGNESENDLRG
jgi:lipoprotein signal peptidase